MAVDEIGNMDYSGVINVCNAEAGTLGKQFPGFVQTELCEQDAVKQNHVFFSKVFDNTRAVGIVLVILLLLDVCNEHIPYAPFEAVEAAGAHGTVLVCPV